MSLDLFFTEADDAVFEKIKRRRLQLIIHSAIYYEYNSNIISDHQYDAWTKELVELNKQYPTYSDQFDEYFIDWAGETGFHFPRTPEILNKAHYLLRVAELKDDRGVPQNK